jgi:hypothetical protein
MAIPYLVKQCLDRFEMLSRSEDILKDLVDEDFGRFRVWAGNVSVHTTGRRSLQYRLRDSSELTEAVLENLKDLLEALGNGTH